MLIAVKRNPMAY